MRLFTEKLKKIKPTPGDSRNREQNSVNNAASIHCSTRAVGFGLHRNTASYIR